MTKHSFNILGVNTKTDEILFEGNYVGNREIEALRQAKESARNIISGYPKNRELQKLKHINHFESKRIY